MGLWSQRSYGFGERLDILFAVVPASNETRGTVAPIVKAEALRPKRCGLRRSQSNEYFIGFNRVEKPFGRGPGYDLRGGICCLGIVEPQIAIKKGQQLRRQKPSL